MNKFTEKKQLDSLLKKLFPICRSLAGENNRKTLDIIKQIIPLEILEIPSGEVIYDWKVPEEWKVNEAFIENSDGKKIVDFKKSNLHLVSHSISVNSSYTFDELKNHLFVHEAIENAIPYRTSYYKKDWGFCLTREQYNILRNETKPIKVFIDTTFKKGSMSLGEVVLKGKYKKEILISCYICHPSMANDSLSGVVLTTFLAKHLSEIKNRKWTYRIVFLPETIGSIAYCKRRYHALENVMTGFVITTVGGPDKVSYKQSWDKNHWINYLVEKILYCERKEFITYPFDIHGSDERQYSSPPFRLNTISIFRSKYYEYPFYHTSLDNLEFVKVNSIQDSLDDYKNLLMEIEKLCFYKRTIKACEPMLSSKELYPKLGGDKIFKKKEKYNQLDLILWIMFYCDGNTPTLDIARKLKLDIKSLSQTIKLMEKKNLIRMI